MLNEAVSIASLSRVTNGGQAIRLTISTCFMELNWETEMGVGDVCVLGHGWHRLGRAVVCVHFQGSVKAASGKCGCHWHCQFSKRTCSDVLIPGGIQGRPSLPTGAG